MRRDLKWRESVGADSFMRTFVSESTPLGVCVICVVPHAACGFVQLSQFIYRPARLFRMHICFYFHVSNASFMFQRQV